MKGIILAGGSGTRLYPSTFAVSKQILPVYDKPMIYYPLSVLMLAGIREIMVISTERDLPLFKSLLGDGKALGLSFCYVVQEKPRGIAEAFLLAEDFLAGDGVCLVLGDNVFYGQSFSKTLEDAMLAVTTQENGTGAAIFGYLVSDPSAYGVLETDDCGNVISIEEKPEKPKSKYAVPGLYFYGGDIVTAAKSIKPSPRGELEITDVNKYYMEQKRLKAFLFGRGMAWLDTGSHETLLDASNFVAAVQNRQGLYVSCIEEIAFRKGYIDKEQLLSLAKPLLKTAYGEYLVKVADNEF